MVPCLSVHICFVHVSTSMPRGCDKPPPHIMKLVKLTLNPSAKAQRLNRRGMQRPRLELAKTKVPLRVSLPHHHLSRVQQARTAQNRAVEQTGFDPSLGSERRRNEPPQVLGSQQYDTPLGQKTIFLLPIFSQSENRSTPLPAYGTAPPTPGRGVGKRGRALWGFYHTLEKLFPQSRGDKTGRRYDPRRCRLYIL